MNFELQHIAIKVTKKSIKLYIISNKKMKKLI
jgi:hypothetical protein